MVKKSKNGVETNFASLFEKLKVEDPWLPPRTWNPFLLKAALFLLFQPQSPISSSSQSPMHSVLFISKFDLYEEAILVRLPLNALQGLGSYQAEDNQNHGGQKVQEEEGPKYSLVNQVFSVAIGKVADPAHGALLKFLFLRSREPYCEFIRSWIFKAEINDPYKEFVVEYIAERNGAAVPCFLKDILVPLVRAGQQLQVLMKLLELHKYVDPGRLLIQIFFLAGVVLLAVIHLCFFNHFWQRKYRSLGSHAE
ncbi:hypothetical protein F3Y22_tig00003715pilonHSYRG00001 [Hibiscus syriacus]|uniref:Gamma-tubulin complex component n=1 Tax=Hibiscus syriacus TaxID=106335 RepID=A0A6A3CJ24_HIBSY|nr:hypothetical protein F3Y22_tig00003715pilonHSYRG00001 [Hibiscus syriacus]